MQPKSIKYEELYPTGSYLNARLGVEMLVNDTDDPIKAFSAAKEICDRFHREKFPQFYQQPTPEYKGETQPIIPVKKSAAERRKEIIEKMKRDIPTCTEVKTLKAYETIVKTYPELKEVYDSTMSLIIG